MRLGNCLDFRIEGSGLGLRVWCMQCGFQGAGFKAHFWFRV